jgi:DNA-directed RNA polymerase specialized sigma24 family protein
VQRSGSLALVEKTSQRGIADDRDLEFSTWVPRISSNCEIETRDKRQRQKEYVHTERGIEEEEKIGFVVAEEKRETNKWWVFCFCWGSSKRSSKQVDNRLNAAAERFTLLLLLRYVGFFCFSFFFFLPGSFLARMNF